MSTPSDLQALFANLKPRPTSAAPSNSSNAPATHSSGNTTSQFDPAAFIARQASNNPLASPPANTSRMNSPFPGPGAAGQDQARSLLNLLKSAQPAQDGRSASEGPAASSGAHGRGISASDLVASFMSGGAPPAGQPGAGRQSVPPPQSAGQPSAQAENPQHALLKLLNRSQSATPTNRPHVMPQPARVDSYQSGDSIIQSIEPVERATPQPPTTVSNGARSSPIRVFGGESKETTPFELERLSTPAAQTPAEKPLFTYKNPFEQLTAISRGQTPQPQRGGLQSPAPSNGLGGNNPGEKRASKEESPEPSAASRRKLTPRLKKTSSASDSVKKETVSEKLEFVASEADKAADEALAQMADVSIKQEPVDDQNFDLDALADQLEDATIQAAIEIKHELDLPENKGALEQELPPSLAREVRYIIDEAAENAPSQSKSATATEQGSGHGVPVYNFPIKPFVSISINLPSPKVGVREDGVMEISRFKKEFDQLDRSLAAATSKYIVYALVKSGGMRIIRQDDGTDHLVFKHSHDRVFNVVMCSTAANSTPTDQQAILGTGVGGSVYYSTIFRDGTNLFEQDALESESLIFPPYPLGDENTSGGQLKTRAKKSSRHPEFFAIGRGKHIHIVWPTLAMSSKYGVQGENRKVDVEKFFKERTLKITTGKAGKDFAFSEDDTMIVSLDKTGKLRFWDIRQLVDEANATATKVQAIDIRIPLLTLATSSSSDKVWPTSALFIDKLRPYSKGTALRYVLVGLRQNHTLQLWDISLGKAVQEIHFPHETENDGICSINYHPGSGIIVVGHPTRNSIYFIHLSAPRYGLSAMSQSAYIEAIAVKSADLPKPESTACMSGIRELSFGSKGQLRSVELLPLHKSTTVNTDEQPALFELYVVHSKGVTCLSIKKQDLGWNDDSKTINPVNALEEGLITMRSIDIGTVAEDEPDVNGEAEPQAPPPPKKEKKKSQKTTEEASQPPAEPSIAIPRDPSPTKPTNGIEPVNEPTSSKKKKKKSQQAALPVPGAEPVQSSRSASPQKAPQAPPQAPEVPKVEATVPEMPTVPELSATSTLGEKAPEKDDSISVGVSGDWLDKEMRKLEDGVTGALKKDFDKLHRQIDIERKVQDAAASTRQEAMLRLISETLSDNVEKSLARIIISNFQQAVIPTLTTATIQTVEQILVRHLHGIVPNEVGKHLPMAISAAMSNPQTLRVLTDNVSQKIAHSVENAFTELLHTTVTPSFKSLAIHTAESMSVEVERRVMGQLQTYEAERQADRRRIDDVMETVNGMAKTLTDMARSQIDFQQQILQDRRAAMSATGASASAGANPGANGEAKRAPKSAIEIEIDDLRELIGAGDYHNATIQWLRSNEQSKLFDEVFAPMDPNYLAEVTPLVAFSVAVTLSNTLQTNTRVKVNWIDIALQCIDVRYWYYVQDDEIVAIADRSSPILSELISKLESCYMAIHQQNTSDPMLKEIPIITKRAKELRMAFARSTPY